jgi:outer membrane protein assembly factor BamB
MNARFNWLRITLFLVGMVSLAGLCWGAESNWPRFRGPNGTGSSTDKEVPTRWSAPLWKIELPGTGHSSPIVWGDRIFVQSATKSERLLVCLEASTGKQVWVQKSAGKVAHTHQKNTLASSTPATDGERVYALFWDGKSVSLNAFDFAGTSLWNQDLGAFKSQHGPGFSPMIADGKVIVNNDQDGSAVLLAFDSKTGKKAWSVERKAFRSCYSTPILHDQGGTGPELLVSSTAGITSYDPRSGTENWYYEWSFPGMALRTVGSPVTGNGVVFATSGDGSGDRNMIAVKLGGKGDVTKTALLWNKDQKRETPYVPTVVVQGEHLYYVNDDGFAACLIGKTGEEVWRQRLNMAVAASLILVDGKIYVVGERGDVIVYEASPAGYRQIAKNSVGETVLSSPAVAQGRLYIRGEKHLFCFGKK